MTVPKALEILYVEKGLPPNLDDLGTNVLICAIYRRTKEAFRQYQTPLTSWIPTAHVSQHWRPAVCSTTTETWPPALPILSKWRNSACDCLDILHWNANGAIAKAGGWEHPAVLSLHLSRLLILAPIHELQRIAPSTSVQQHAIEEDCLDRRDHIPGWVFNDQHKARLSVVHAGALLWHIRRYRMGGFLEPFAAFMATLVIWAYSSTLQLNAKQSQLEDDYASPNAVDEDPDPSFLHLDRPLDDELVQTYVISGLRMQAFLSGVGDIRAKEAPRKILSTGICILAGLKVGRQVARNGTPESAVGDNSDGVGGWAIEQVYINRLERLMRSTERE